MKDLGNELWKHGLEIGDIKAGRREMCNVPQILGPLPEEEVELPDERAPWYLVWVEIKGAWSQLESLRVGRLKVQLPQPVGGDLPVKFLLFFSEHRTKTGVRRVAMPRAGVAADIDTTSNSDGTSSMCQSHQSKGRRHRATAPRLSQIAHQARGVQRQPALHCCSLFHMHTHRHRHPHTHARIHSHTHRHTHRHTDTQTKNEHAHT
jgi:hypothetical protein